MSLPVFHSTPTSLCGVEIRPGSVPHPDMTKVGYISIKPPLNTAIPRCPRTYRCGFNHKGKIIGRNMSIPYPGELPRYHNVPFLRNVEWAAGTGEPNNREASKSEQEREEEAKEQDETCGVGGDTQQTTTETATTTRTDTAVDNSLGEDIDEYFTAENDDGYRTWAQRKARSLLKSCEYEVQKQKEKENRRVCREKKNTIEKMKLEEGESYNVASNSMPVLFQSTNQVYGSYAELTANYPTNTLYRKQNPETTFMHGTPPIDPTPAGLMGSHMDRRYRMKNYSSSKTTCFSVFNPPKSLGWQRDHGYTFPYITPTGLEMDRQPSTYRSLFSNMVHQQDPEPTRVFLAKPAPTQLTRVTIPYCVPAHKRGSRVRVPGLVDSQGSMCVEIKPMLC